MPREFLRAKEMLAEGFRPEDKIATAKKLAETKQSIKEFFSFNSYKTEEVQKIFKVVSKK